MHRIIATSLKLRYVVLMIAAVVLFLGFDAIQDIPIDVLPEFNPPFVEIQTEALGLSAAEVESLITVPMEADLLNGVAWLDHITSESVAGLSSIRLIFEPGTDPIRARQMVQERLTQAFALPNVSRPPIMLQPLSSTNRVMMIGLSSRDLSLIDLSILARWNLKPRLMGVPGVANVAIWGQRERQLQVQIDPNQLRTQGVTLQQVIETAGNALWVSPLSFLNASTPGTAGWIDTPNQRLGLRHVLPISGADDLGSVSVVGSDTLRLSDVTSVVEDHQPLIGDAVVNNGSGLLLVVEKFPGASTVEVTENVEEALAAMRPGLTGVEMDTTVFRPAQYIQRAITHLAVAAAFGAVLVALLLFTFFNSWRLASAAVIVVLLTLVVAGLVVWGRGMTANALVIAGIAVAIGVIVDDAIVDIENIGRRLRQSRADGGHQPSSFIIRAVPTVRSPLIFATLIIILLLLVPTFFIHGSSAAFFWPAIFSAGVAVLASTVIALTVTPVLGLMVLRRGDSLPGPSPVVTWLVQRYREILRRAIASPRLVLATIALLTLGAVVLTPFLTLSGLPSFQQTDLLIQWEAAPGTSGLEMNRITSQVSQELRSIPGVRNVGAHIGRAVTGDQVVAINAGELWISLDPTAPYDATVAAVQTVIDGYPGIAHTVEPYQPQPHHGLFEGPGDDLIVRVYGHDWDTLRRQAERVQQRMATVEGVVDAHLELQANEPQVEIEVDLDKAEQHRIKPGDVRRQAAVLLSGLQVGNLFEEQKVFDVVVWGVPTLRTNLTTLDELLIETPSGHVQLGQLAAVRIAPAPVNIKRDAVSRYIDVVARLPVGKKGALASEVKSELTKIDFPLEYHAEVLGASASHTGRRLGILIAVLIGIFLIWQAAFMSWRVALLCFLAVPAALWGGVLAILVTGAVLSLGSLLGLVAVVLIAIRNATVMIKDWQRLEATDKFGPDLILEGARRRLLPTVMTALAVGAVFLPSAVFGTIAGHEILHPMAIVILGGLFSSTVLALFGLPALYLRFRKA